MVWTLGHSSKRLEGLLERKGVIQSSNLIIFYHNTSLLSELDYIGKFEDYDSVVRQLEKQTGTTVKKVHTQSGKKKKTHLTKGEKDIVYDIYEKDFKIFGYAR